MEGVSLKINIPPPFWATIWFISLLIISVTGLVAYFITSYVRQLLAVERLRTKLAADLHDNIGASLTEISILSEVISKKIKDKNEGIQKNLKRISEDSRSLIDKMSDIVWLVNPKRDSLYDLILRLEDTYSELLSMTDISFTSKNLKSLEKITLTMERRQHLYLIFKEGINNCITHGECTAINLDAHVNNKNLEMILTDNGKGFEVDHEYLGNGLKNMIQRAEQIGGELIIKSEIGKGTRLEFHGKIA
jgi:signal transduction histidine kinase